MIMITLLREIGLTYSLQTLSDIKHFFSNSMVPLDVSVSTLKSMARISQNQPTAKFRYLDFVTKAI